MTERVPSSLPWLSLLLPTAAEMDLVRACLWTGAPVQRAWQRWQQSVGDPLRAIHANVSGVKSLLPLLHRGLQRGGGDIDPAVRASVAAAAVAEAVRWRAYAAVCARAFHAMLTARVPYLVLKGPALAVSVYPDTALRHSHDVDLLVRAPDLERAATALGAVSFLRPPPAGQRSPADACSLVDESGLTIEMHTRAFRLPYYTLPFAELWERAHRCEIAGVPAQTLAVADHLVYVCGQASCCASRHSLKWVADAWFLMEGDVDWEAFLSAARRSRLMLPVAVLLRALAVELQAPVPAAVLDRLDAGARTADCAARDVALAGVRAGGRAPLRNLFRVTPGWRARLDLLRWMLLPSPTALRQGEPLRYPRAWPLYYLGRPLASVTRRVASWCRLPARATS